MKATGNLVRATLLALLTAGLAPMLATASPVRVVVGPGGPIDLPRGSEVVAIGPAGVLARAPVVSWEEEVRFDVPEGADRISAEAEGMWCSSTPFEERAPADAARRVSCWRSGKIRGTVASATRGGEVTALAVRFEPAQDAKGGVAFPGGELQVPVERGSWEAVIPEGRFDLVLRSRGFGARYLFGVAVGPGTPRNLGAIELRPGASLVGSVEVAGAGRLDPDRCLITLRPEAGDSRGTGAGGAVRTSRTVRPTARGFFQLEGVDAGRWKVVASQPGLAEATRDVEIANGLEASLNDPLVLGEYGKLELGVRPPLDPAGSTWIVEVIEMRTGAAPERVVESPLAADGSWSYARMVTGRRYVVRLKTSLGVGWWKDVEPFEMAAAHLRRSIEVRVEEVRGKVLLGRRPIAAVVTFGGEGRFPAIRMESDVSGRFEGKLPRLGAWSVSVRSSGPTVLRSTDVDVPAPGDDGVSDVEVRLPGGGLPGEIVNEAGDRVPNAVLAIVARGWREANTELIPDGTFLLEGLADGEYVVSAFLPRGGAESDGVLVRIEDGEVEEPVRLVLLPLHAIRGRTVAAPGIGLPRASVERLPDPGPVPLRGSLPPAGLDGSWVAEVARTRDFACLIHGSPGRATRMFRMEPRPEQQEVLLTSVGGELVVNATKMPEGGPFPALFHNGCMGYQRALGRQGLAAESEESGVVRVQGLFEPGEYSLCMITHEEHATYGGGRPAFPSCVHGTLLPGARLELTAPDR